MHAGDEVMQRLGLTAEWLPRAVLHYLAHTESGAPIRALARDAGCHASTVLRQVRNYESRRDDMLVDSALRRLGRRVRADADGWDDAGSCVEEVQMKDRNAAGADADPGQLSGERLTDEARRVLRRMCEAGAILAVAPGMDRAAVVRDTGDGRTLRRAVVDREIAEALALNGWIARVGEGRVLRYRITAAGRAVLGRMLAEGENRALGLAEAAAPFDSATPATRAMAVAGGAADRGGSRRPRYGPAESPLVALARRREHDGTPFLGPELLRAGERLREDFELAQMPADRTGFDWDRFLTGPQTRSGLPGLPGGGGGPEAARARVTGALRDLGPGLGDVALRCCCRLEGLEAAEKAMGWSARSAKIVLRIALQRLRSYYARLGDAGDLIG